MNFPLEYQKIIQRIENINPKKYAQTRNHLDGAVTYLSPYITRGVITLPQIRDIVLEKYSKKDSEKLIQELTWREYFQKIYQSKGDEIFDDLRFDQQGVEVENEIPESIINAQTGITIIDESIKGLYETGYMHNHARMWVSSIATNVAHCHWWQPSQWMYYHLLDGDLASNSLSWQWVSGAFASKQYVAHQELMNACSPLSQSQTGTFMDINREDILDMDIPEVLEKTIEPELSVFFPEGDNFVLNEKDLVLFHSWNLDPNYHAGEDVQKILVIEPSHFQKFPVSEKVMNFIVNLAKENIEGIQIFVGEQSELIKDFKGEVYYQDHQNVQHWKGNPEQQAELFPEVQGYYKNFFSFWKECQKFM
ncbi:MAG: deoxyribodipyrimidine photolyase [Candidatus Pacebacteria bacterium]|nr:deoxyribodipyrimidine photolyase [Candidatus Paceibacterota bacterium]